ADTRPRPRVWQPAHDGAGTTRHTLDVVPLEHALPARLPQPCDELRPEHVDVAVQHAPPERDLALLRLVALDELFELLVGERGEIGEGVGFHSPPSKAAGRARGQPQL